MKYDDQKISEVVLALLGVFEFENDRVWKKIELASWMSYLKKAISLTPKAKQSLFT